MVIFSFFLWKLWPPVDILHWALCAHPKTCFIFYLDFCIMHADYSVSGHIRRGQSCLTVYAKCWWKINVYMQFSYLPSFFLFLAKNESTRIIVKNHFNKKPEYAKTGPTGEICTISAEFIVLSNRKLHLNKVYYW